MNITFLVFFSLLNCLFLISAASNKVINILIYNLQSNRNLFSTNVQLGSQNETFPLKIDLWSDVSWIMSQSCISCLNYTKFNDLQSQSLIKTNQSMQVDYTDLVDVYGKVAQDQFNIDVNNYKIQGAFNFLLVSDSNLFFESFVGSLGFGLPKPENFNTSLIYQLRNKGQIEDLKMGISLKQYGETSALTLGGVDPNIVRNDSSIMYCNSTNESGTYWGCQMKEVNVGSTNLQMNNRSLVFDTGVEDIKMPLKDFMLIKASLIKGSSTCQYGRDNYFHCTCENVDRSTIESINVTLSDGNILSISPNDFAFVQTQSPDNYNCVLFISVNYKSDVWIVGNNFLNNFYTILDFENRTIGLLNLKAQHDGENSMTILFITIIFVFSTCFFFIILLAIYRKCVSRPQNDRGVRNAYQQL